jgi:hypothetical protein
MKRIPSNFQFSTVVITHLSLCAYLWHAVHANTTSSPSQSRQEYRAMASAPTITPKKRFGMKTTSYPWRNRQHARRLSRHWHRLQQKVPCQWIPFRLVRRKCYAWNDPSTFFGRIFQRKLLSKRRYGSIKFRTVPSCNQLKRFSVFEMPRRQGIR